MMAHETDRRELELIQRIMDAPVIEDGWTPALLGIGERLSAPHTWLALRLAHAEDPGEIVAPDLSAVASQRLLEGFRDDPERWRALDANAPGSIVNWGPDVMQALSEASPWVTEMRDGDQSLWPLWQMATAVWRGTQQGGVLVLSRREEQDPFAAHDEASFARIVPFLLRAIEVHRRLEWLRLERDESRAILDALPIGIMLTGEGGELLHANTSANEMLEEGEVVVLEADRVRARDPRARASFDDLLRRTAATGQGNASMPGGDMRLPRRAGGRDVEVNSAPIGRDSASFWHADRPSAVTFVADSKRGPELPPARLQRLYDLTPAEASLASRLARGESLDQAAGILGRSRFTVRKQLQCIFEKTRTHRQGELVHLLLTGVAGGTRPAD